MIKKNNLRISIITVCFNSAKTIENTFKSVRNQTYKNIEYIVVDGNSKDNTSSIVLDYQDVINIFVSEPDKGLYDAMNKGIKLATGDLIGILNSDDVFFNDSVLDLIAKFHDNHEIDASIGDVVYVNDSNTIKRIYSSKKWIPNKLKIGFMPPHASIFFKKKIFDKYGSYKLNYLIGADYEIISRFFLAEKISWKHSNVITTKMLIGGLSSSGYKSYSLISKEIKKALIENNIEFNFFKIKFRILWKIKELMIK